VVWVKTNFVELQALIERKRDVPAVCEGKKDVAALRELGFSVIIELDRPLYAVVERFEKGSTVQLLVDLDAEGKKLFALLRADLTHRGVHIDNELREALFRTPVRQIEGLASYLRDN
jgi:5S rRNA maturation endonuclease (ribonuclease M5)